MQYQRLGKTGLVVSRICLGMMSYGDPQWRAWVLTEEAGRPIVQKAVESGINFFDTANGYSNGASEEVTGRYLREFFTRRDEYVLTTQVFFPVGDKPNQGGLSRKHIFDSVNDSLRRLNTEYIDLFQIHRWDPNTPIEETMEALHDVVKSGKVRYLARLDAVCLDAESLQFNLPRRRT
jgi:aryl-alcohol dehydrogenase-like predicted oxidoreductase